MVRTAKLVVLLSLAPATSLMMVGCASSESPPPAAAGGNGGGAVPAAYVMSADGPSVATAAPARAAAEPQQTRFELGQP